MKIKDGIDGRRIEAQGFASTLDAVAGFDWTEDHGDSAVLEKDFVETANYTEKIDQRRCGADVVARQHEFILGVERIGFDLGHGPA